MKTIIKINGIENLYPIEGVQWGGSKETVSRSLIFSLLYNPLIDDLPKHNLKVNDKVELVDIDENKEILRFFGYVEKIEYSTDDNLLQVTCTDLMKRLLKSKCVGRFQGTLTQLADKICGMFNLENGINVDNPHVNNIVSEGDLSYYDVLKTACEAAFQKYCLYMDGTALKLVEQDIKNTFEIGINIRKSEFTQDLSNLVTKVIIIDNNGNILNTVTDNEGLSTFGLFQEIYNYNKDSKNNLADAQKMLHGIDNASSLVCNNDNSCISGCFIKVIEPANGFQGIFEIKSDNHTIAADSEMTLEIEFVRNE